MEELRCSGRILKLTQGSAITGSPRALLCGTAGTFTGTDQSGNTLTNLPLQAGYNPIKIASWTAGTASDVWALY